MARMDELLQGAKIILDNLYTTDEDLTYIIDMALKKVSTDAPILIRELKIDEPPEVINFGLMQNCIEDETIDCCEQAGQGGGSNQNNDGGSTINYTCCPDRQLATLTLNAYIENDFIIQGVNGHIMLVNNTGEDLLIKRDNEEITFYDGSAEQGYFFEFPESQNYDGLNKLVIEVNEVFDLKYGAILFYDDDRTNDIYGTILFEMAVLNSDANNTITYTASSHNILGSGDYKSGDNSNIHTIAHYTNRGGMNE